MRGVGLSPAAAAIDLDAPIRPGSTLSAGAALALFEAQMESRHLDFAARWLRSRGQGYYTIGSSGHEGNAAVAEATRVTDPALLHYRSGGFFVRRARKAQRQDSGSGRPAVDALGDVLLGVVASRQEPIAGGRHKVFGSIALTIWPQTSTIASHLPKAVGTAFALERKKRLGLALDVPEDAIIACSFGDATVNHSTAVGAINTACWTAHQGLPMPILFVCEDNGLGISVRTPKNWLAAVYGQRSGLGYFRGDGCDMVSAYEAAQSAVDHVRTTRKPAFLHLSMVRLMGHAGSDVELAYRSPGEIRGDLTRDPLRRSAEILIEAGILSAEEVIDRYQTVRAGVRARAEKAAGAPQLHDADDIMAPIAPHDPDAVAAEVKRPVEQAARGQFWRDRLPEEQGPVPLAEHVRRALGDILVKYPEAVIFGQDVGRKGGVYGVTRGLQERAGMARVFDTLLDEQSILGLAIGAGQTGMLPIAEIQYLAYLHNAIDQLRGEAATLSFFSQGQLSNPMVVRVASYAYQKGFGGHFHNDNSIAALGDIPGLVIASPSRGDDAAAMLHTCIASARCDGTVSVFLEPIALYPIRDLYRPGDGELAAPYQPTGAHVPIGSARLWGDGSDLLMVSFANGVYMSLRAARRLADNHGVRCRVLDLRWLAPLPIDDLMGEASKAENVLIVDETRQTGGVSERILTALVEHGFAGTVRRVASLDSFVPLGPAAGHVLVGESDIAGAALAMLGIEDSQNVGFGSRAATKK
ncbi:MAG: thiamine pyrophosphate-dependent enzyme [Proteobacteria bacterium]|nr:thiamine pyrophosphate-dependent enzyme [Pseudomonadota bacterium]